MGSDRHFLDTSVARHLLTASTFYRRYLDSEIGPGPREVSGYVVMEFRRGFLIHLMAFYAFVDMPHRHTVGDAMIRWAERFKPAELKAVLILVGHLIDIHQLSRSKPEDKAKTLRLIARYIKRQEIKLQAWNTGRDSTHCACATIPMKVSVETAGEDFDTFSRGFKNAAACRGSCRIDDFLLRDNRNQVATYRDNAAEVPKNRGGKGFSRIGENLSKILTKGADACTCGMCGAIGDAVIALDAPREARLETTDYSFDHLCPPISQPHRRHRSAQAAEDSHGFATPKDASDRRPESRGR